MFRKENQRNQWVHSRLRNQFKLLKLKKLICDEMISIDLMNFLNVYVPVNFMPTPELALCRERDSRRWLLTLHTLFIFRGIEYISKAQITSNDIAARAHQTRILGISILAMVKQYFPHSSEPDRLLRKPKVWFIFLDDKYIAVVTFDEPLISEQISFSPALR